jgi:hypothetical protein
MPSKLIIFLVAAGTVGAAAIAGTALTLGKEKNARGASSAAAISEEMGEATALDTAFELADAGDPPDVGSSGPVSINPDDFGAAPDLESSSSAPATGTSSRWGIGKEKLQAPAAQACVTKDEMNEALMGSGCDCSCDGYAAQLSGPASAQCDLACGIAWYVCWAPDPTQQEIESTVLSTLDGYDPQARALMEPTLREQLQNPEGVAGYRGAIMADRAFTWNDDRMCPEQ